MRAQKVRRKSAGVGLSMVTKGQENSQGTFRERPIHKPSPDESILDTFGGVRDLPEMGCFFLRASLGGFGLQLGLKKRGARRWRTQRGQPSDSRGDLQ